MRTILRILINYFYKIEIEKMENIWKDEFVISIKIPRNKLIVCDKIKYEQIKYNISIIESILEDI